MKESDILFIQGGGKDAYQADKKLVSSLKESLKDGYIVRFPKMPDEDNPDYEKYKNSIEKEIEKGEGSIILAGHSLGSCFLLKYLSEHKTVKEIKGLFLLSTPFWGGFGWQYEGFRLTEGFGSKLPFNTPVFLYHGAKDETVPFAHLALYAEQLPDATIREIAGAGHQFNNDLSVVARDIKSLNK